ncbi:MAG TPA: adenosine kinase [Thermoanaerobaculia bacterium]|nr:adenosine kinase [Thermoanaerobaculia bacterium]
MSGDLDVLCIGNAIVDVLTHADDAFLKTHALTKGAMMLIDAAAAERLYSHMGPGIECSGGSAGNTAAGVASLGGRAGYVGKVADDQLGQLFAHDIRAIGVEYETPPLEGGAPTARSLIVVTPDAQRTMSTYLGACVALGPQDIDPEQVGRARVTYFEGYLWDPPAAKDAIRSAIQIAKARGRKVSLTLSDSFCVDRYRDEFRELIEGSIDILFANEAEIESLYQTKDFDSALHAVKGKCPIAVLTRSAKGSMVVTEDTVHTVPAAPARVVDTTGAGDLYASGFLYGFTQGRPLPECARLGGIAAAEIISQFGARPDVPLKTLL